MSSNTSSDTLGAPQVPEISEVPNEVTYGTTELPVEERTSSDESSDSEDEYIARGNDKTLFQTLTSKTKNDKPKKQAAAPGGDPSRQPREPPKTSVPNNDQRPPKKSPKKK